MANLYVRSTDGDDADNGTTWALAKATLAGAGAIDSAGDVIYVSQAHAESNASAQTIALAGTLASPVKVICGNDAAAPPTATATTATITTTGASTINVTGNCYVYGISFSAGSGAVNASFNIGTSTYSKQTYEQCTITIPATGSSTGINLASSANAAPSRFDFRNVTVSFGGANNSIKNAMSYFTWYGGATAGEAVTTLISVASSGESSKSLISGVDISSIGASANLVNVSANAVCDVVFRDCKLPASWTGVPMAGSPTAGDRVELYNCDSADTNYRVYIHDYFGTVRDSTSVYNDAGVDDGSGQGFSWAMASEADCEFPHQVLRSPEIHQWNDTTGSAITATVEIVHNSQGAGTNGALLDTEIWLEVMYLGTSGVPLGSWITDRCGNLNLNSDAADQASSSATWTGDGAGWDTQKLSVSFTPQDKGYLVARVILAKPSVTVYVDPLITVS